MGEFVSKGTDPGPPLFGPDGVMPLYDGRRHPILLVVTEEVSVEGTPPTRYDTPLSLEQKDEFAAWKKRFAPDDAGEFYDFPGAFLAGVTPDAVTGRWSPEFAKPSDPLFSTESRYVRYAPQLAGTWNVDGSFTPSAERLRWEERNRIGLWWLGVAEIMWRQIKPDAST